MIEKNKLIKFLKNNAWNSKFSCRFKTKIYSRPNPPHISFSVINFSLLDIGKNNIYQAIIIGSSHTYPIDLEYELIEYIDHIERYYILEERKPSEFNDLFKLKAIKEKSITIDYIYELTQATQVSKIWIICDNLITKEILLLHKDNSYSFISWELHD